MNPHLWGAQRFYASTTTPRESTSEVESFRKKEIIMKASNERRLKFKAMDKRKSLSFSLPVSFFAYASFVSNLKLNLKWILFAIGTLSISIVFFISLLSPHRPNSLQETKASVESQSSKPSFKNAVDFSDLFPSNEALDPSRLKLHIKVLTFNRLNSLIRCLLSLQNALYDGDTVSLTILIDHSFDTDQTKHWDARSEERISVSHELLRHVDTFAWKHGPKRVHYKSHNGGIQPQWLEAWWPESPNDFAFIVEDDVEVSPLYYRYFKKTLLNYYYKDSNFNPHLYGISFQRQYFVPGYGANPLNYSIGTPFLYQLVGTWGQFLFPHPWKQFRLWYDRCRYNDSRQPYLEGLVSNEWFKAKGHVIWTPWIIKWAYSANMYNMYLGFPDNYTLSISHREKGTNYGQTMGPDAQLLRASTEPTQLIRFISMSQMRKLDYCCRLVPRGVLLQTWKDWKSLLSSNFFAKRVVPLVFVPPGGYDVARNWLCHLDGLNINQFVLVLTEAKEALDLSSRGYVAYHITESDGKTIGSLPLGIVAWSLPHMQLVYEVLSFGFNIIITNPYSIWLDCPSSRLLQSQFDIITSFEFDFLYDSLLFIKSMDNVLSVWKDVISMWNDTMPAAASDVADANLLSLRSREMARIFLSEEISIKHSLFAPFEASKAFELTKEVMPITLTAPGKSKSSKIQFLNSSGLWVIDDYDFACKTVSCIKSLPKYV